MDMGFDFIVVIVKWTSNGFHAYCLFDFYVYHLGTRVLVYVIEIIV